MRIGIVGYGAGGQYFHAPFIEAAEDIELVGIVARSDAKKAGVEADFPGLPVYSSLGELLAAGVDAVTITTPPHTRHDLVMEAIKAGVHVVADKPFAPNAQAARELAEAAARAGVVLNVYHNRRRDADVLTLADVLASGKLGEIWRVHSTMDQDNAGSLEVGASGGLLRDLGSHLVDQMLWLLGPASHVHATLDWTDRRLGARELCRLLCRVRPRGPRQRPRAGSGGRRNPDAGGVGCGPPQCAGERGDRTLEPSLT